MHALPSPLESSTGPFAARQPLFTHGELTLRIVLPRSADELIDEDAFNRDERLPYWADLWPSARALARWLLDNQHHIATTRNGQAPRAIEVGCGATALASLALSRSGVDVIASDYEPDALDIVAANAARNATASCGAVRTRLIDWRTPPDDLGRFDLVLGADLMYEHRNAIALGDFTASILADGGSMILADPDRRYLAEFQARMRQRGFTERELAMIVEPNDDDTRPPTRVRIIQFAR